MNYVSGLNIPGAVLIFLPGWNLIFALHKHLKMHPQFGKSTFSVIIRLKAAINHRMTSEEFNVDGFVLFEADARKRRESNYNKLRQSVYYCIMLITALCSLVVYHSILYIQITICNTKNTASHQLHEF